MSKHKVVFTPNWSENNPYQSLLAKSIEEQYFVAFEQYPFSISPFSKLLRKHPDMYILHMHWVTEIVRMLSWSRSNLIFHLKLVILIRDIKFIQKKGVKVVWTIHNKLVHQKTDKYREILIRRKLAQSVDTIILHSEPALIEVSELYGIDLSQKAKVIFHGNYEGCYPPPSKPRDVLRDEYGVSINQVLALYFGSIRPYKGVDKLIDAYLLMAEKKTIKIIIAGGVPDKDYQQKLESKLLKAKQVKCYFEFISEQHLSDLLCAADLVVIPFVDTLTSGSTLLAMTAGKALFLPYNATVFGCVPENGAVYFNSVQQLSYELGNVDLKKLMEMGSINRKKAANMEWKRVAELTHDAYSSG